MLGASRNRLLIDLLAGLPSDLTNNGKKLPGQSQQGDRMISLRRTSGQISFPFYGPRRLAMSGNDLEIVIDLIKQ